MPFNVSHNKSRKNARLKNILEPHEPNQKPIRSFLSPLNKKHARDTSAIEFIPICDWPMADHPPEPSLKKTGLKESKCRRVFMDWIKAADESCSSLEPPKEMQLFLNEQGKLEGIRLISRHDGLHKDFLEFGGRLQYIAPELIENTEYHAKSVNVWSLGIILYCLLIGRYPFNEIGLSHQALFDKMIQLEYTLPLSLSSEARDLIERMMAPQTSRISFDSLLCHPWFKKTKTRNPILLVKNTLHLIFHGPYPFKKRPL
ncbi:hypothetical protein G6F43_007349 [Rhizopus delemar]|nr:hypothetical protein G6F43_007349 [Rhizopus delemar]